MWKRCTSAFISDFSIAISSLEKVIHFPFIATWTAQNTTTQRSLNCPWEHFTEPLSSNDTGIQTQAQQYFNVVFVAAGTFLPSLFLATIGWIYMQTE
jgi:hypothetical protein